MVAMTTTGQRPRGSRLTTSTTGRERMRSWRCRCSALRLDIGRQLQPDAGLVAAKVFEQPDVAASEHELQRVTQATPAGARGLDAETPSQQFVERMDVCVAVCVRRVEHHAD